MQSLNHMFSEALSAVSVCCPPLTSCFIGDDRRQTRDNEKPEDMAENMSATRHLRPYILPTPPPYYGTSDQNRHHYGQSWHGRTRSVMRSATGERPPKKSFSSSIRDFSVRKHKKPISRGRPHISAPSNFRHIYHETVDMPSSLQQPRRAPHPGRDRPTSFRPLELSIYMPQQRLSPLLPQFGTDGSDFDLPPPPRAHTRNQHSGDDASTLVHQQSYSSLSFHIPRRGPSDNFSLASGSENAPSPPPKSKARMRANTAPDTDRMLERIASAIIEKEMIENQIHHVMERQSIYSYSRPSTGHEMQDLEPMPSIPALPPTEGLTFAERVSTPAPLAVERPRTAPPPQPTTPRSAYTELPLPLAASSPLRTMASKTPPPPLPLVLRPPLRKKKSFSRVSNWLFPSGQEGEREKAKKEHERSLSRDSITNLPRPVKDSEGFYQCVVPGGQRTSFDSVSTLSTEEGGPTAASTWSPSTSSPGSSRATTARVGTSGSGLGVGVGSGFIPQRAGTFGQAKAPLKRVVGVAF